ncbi:MAG: TIGR04211 family SH3 domain-containing protein [Deltaproteobacteria bacterium]|nr:TIGR04211 family SH3 domain-containing protein [Deltaproteobacteria bacterium]
MRVILAVVTAIILASIAVTPPAYSGTKMYIKDSLEVTVRRGQGIEFKIIALLRPNEEVNALGVTGDWTEIQLKKGRHGWVLSRYLTDKEPRAKQVDQLDDKNKELADELKELKSDNAQLTDRQAELTPELDKNAQELVIRRTRHKELKQETASLLNIEESIKKGEEKSQDNSKQLKEIKATLTEGPSYQNIQWFLSGAGTLAGGLMLGGIFARRKRRYRTSLK